MSVSSWHLPIAMATRPQFGSAPCTAVFTSGELTIALATRLACARSRARSTTTSMSVSAPSPSRAIWRVSDSATTPSAASSSSPATGPAAPDASTTAVSLVDVSVSMLTQLNVRSTTRRNTASSSSEVDRGVGQQHGDHRRHVGLDHADALGHADDAGRSGTDRALGDLLDGVGGHDPARRRGEVGAGRRGGHGGRAGEDPVHRVAPPDDAGRGDEDVGGVAAEPCRRRRRRAPRRRRHRRARWRRWRSSTRRRSPAARPSARLRRLIVTLGPANRLRVNTPAAGTVSISGDARRSRRCRP